MFSISVEAIIGGLSAAGVYLLGRAVRRRERDGGPVQELPAESPACRSISGDDDAWPVMSITEAVEGSMPGFRAGELLEKLRHHQHPIPGWCPRDRVYGCEIYEELRDAAIERGLIKAER